MISFCNSKYSLFWLPGEHNLQTLFLLSMFSLYSLVPDDRGSFVCPSNFANNLFFHTFQIFFVCYISRRVFHLNNVSSTKFAQQLLVSTREIISLYSLQVLLILLFLVQSWPFGHCTSFNFQLRESQLYILGCPTAIHLVPLF